MSKHHITQILAVFAIAGTVMAEAPQKPTTPDEALAELKAGNQRFTSGLTKQIGRAHV